MPCSTHLLKRIVVPRAERHGHVMYDLSGAASNGEPSGLLDGVRLAIMPSATQWELNLSLSKHALQCILYHSFNAFLNVLTSLISGYSGYSPMGWEFSSGHWRPVTTGCPKRSPVGDLSSHPARTLHRRTNPNRVLESLGCYLPIFWGEPRSIMR